MPTIKTIFYKITPKNKKIECALDRPDASWEYKTITNYVGTVWFAVNWLPNGKYNLKIAGRKKDLALKLRPEWEVLSFRLEEMDSVMGREYRQKIKDFSK